MTYRSFTVLLDQDPLCAARTRFAIQLANALDCHLVGIAPTGSLGLPVSTGRAASIAEYAALAWDDLRRRAEQAAQLFREACQSAGVKSFEASIDESDTAQSLVRAAQCNDLSVLTQANPSSGDHASTQAMVEQVVLNSARPTLILPYAGQFEGRITRAMVAWDDSREAARAIADALTLLRQAQHVQVLSWEENESAAREALHRRLGELQQWLARHGIAADVQIETTDIDIADAMLSRAADLGADLIVMGAYGHARWAERMLGGATRGLLRSMTVPVLMSR